MTNKYGKFAIKRNKNLWPLMSKLMNPESLEIYCKKDSIKNMNRKILNFLMQLKLS